MKFYEPNISFYLWEPKYKLQSHRLTNQWQKLKMGKPIHVYLIRLVYIYNITLHIRKINARKSYLQVKVLLLHIFFAQNYHPFWYTQYYCIYSLLHNITFFNFVYVESLGAFLFLNRKFIYLHEEKSTYKLSHCFTWKIQWNRLEVLKEMRILRGAKNIIFDAKHTRP